MFEPHAIPRIFGVAPGVDFPRALRDGLLARSEGQPPEALARIQLIVNTARMERRLRQLFDADGPRLLPRIHLLTQLDMLDPAVVLPTAVSPLRRRLELISLVSRLIDQQPELAPRSSLYDLTDSLAALMDELQGEGVPGDAIAALDVSDESGHWQRAQTFIRIAQHFLGETATRPDKEARQRQLVIALAEKWQAAPPANPVILAGSTGSRGTTMLLMEAIAQLPQGALVLPGFDFDMPRAQWLNLEDALLSEDHPQYRFYKLLRQLSLSRGDVAPWHDTPPPSAPRNALVSLSLRPAPVTDAWLTDGPKLSDLDKATAGLTLIEAPSPRAEALAIALRLRKAAEEGQTAALISPDRMLTRQVTAALDQWGILPDDSAGTPLHLSPPGRFLRHTAALLHRRLDAEALLTLLKHPLTHSAANRAAHVLNTQRLELRIRRKGLPYPEPDSIFRLLTGTVTSSEDRAELESWAAWVGATFCGLTQTDEQPLEAWVQAHIALSETVSNGSNGVDAGELWQKKAGQKAREVLSDLRNQARHGGQLSAADYADLVGALLADGEVRDRDAPHPHIMIWGTLEARVQGADLVILAGLNDGTWPEAPAPDPWLNRSLRHKAGLLLPERRIGLAAHDYQQAIAAPEVWLTRAIRSEDAETVASRWINRLVNLLEGLPMLQGPQLLQQMRDRGNKWLNQAVAFEAVKPATPARRPSPRPPAKSRPAQLSVTEIKRLIRDPYAIYARHVLKLNRLGPLVQTPDALLRGNVLHDVMEAFVRGVDRDPAMLTPEALSDVARQHLQEAVAWPAARTLWAARLARVADWFVAQEKARRLSAAPAAYEDDAKGRLFWPDMNFAINARADRIDRSDDDDILIYDYKTGNPPSKAEQAAFDKQLLIEAAMVEEGAFPAIGPAHVSQAVFIGLGASPKEIPAPLDEEPPAVILTQLRDLIRAYQVENQGFTSRRMMQKDAVDGDYDLLARFGEWDVTDEPWPEDLT